MDFTTIGFHEWTVENLELQMNENHSRRLISSNQIILSNYQVSSIPRSKKIAIDQLPAIFGFLRSLEKNVFSKISEYEPRTHGREYHK